MSSRSIAATLCAVIIVAVSAASASQFYGWPLPATEIDFLLTPHILAARNAFQGTAYLSLAENLRAMSALPFIATVLRDGGIPLENQMTYFAFVQTAAVCVSATALFVVLGGRNLSWLTLGALVLFIASGRHYLFYFKLVSSTFVSGFVLLALILALAGKLWPAAIATLVVGAVHPTYFVLTVAAAAIVQWFNNPRRGARERLTALWPFVLCSVPVLIAWAANSRAILQPDVDAARWFAYMTTRSDLSFPLRQGYGAMLGAIVPLSLAAFVLASEPNPDRGDSRPFRALAALAAAGVLLYLAQAVFSDGIKSATLTRLALSHRLPFTLDILVFTAVIWIIVSRLSRDGLLAWGGLAYIGVVGAIRAGFAPDAGLTDRGSLILGALVLQQIERAVRTQDLTRASLVAGSAIVLAVLSALLRLGDSQVLLALVMTAAWIEAMLRIRAGITLPAFAGRAALAVLFAAAAASAMTSIAWRPTARAVETREDYAGFLGFVTSHVPPDDQILAVPFFLTQRYSPVPYRATYLDWVESNYVLYLGSFLDEAIARLSSYGIDPL